ncbi:MAG: MarR family transcriptional regulator [Acidimicrobiales bacterium]|jgi:DNA-binding MarR family transcriptional regulator
MTRAAGGRDGAIREAWRTMAELVLDNQRRREVSEQTGMSFGRMRALRRIARRPLSMRELGTLLGVDPPNLTTVVDGLERAGLVERQAHPTDRRVKLVVATPEGEALARRADEILDRPPPGLADLSIDDLETLVRILSQVRQGGNPDADPAAGVSPR